MKKRILLIALMIAMLVCLLVLCVSAEETSTEEPETEVTTPALPDTSKETVTLDDGTVCALYDTRGIGLIWYVESTDASGNKTYNYVAVDSESANIISTGGSVNEFNDIYVVVNGVTYNKNTLAVINLRQATITGGKDGRVGNAPSFPYNIYSDNTNLEYVYLHLDTYNFGQQAFKGCTNLKYVNFNELTKLTNIGSQAFINCTRLYENRVLDFSNTKLASTETNSLRGNAAIEVILPETFTSLGQETFKDCKYVTKITFTGTLTSINTNYTFQGCSELVEIVGFNIPANTTSIGQYTFEKCKKLKRIDGLMQDGILIIPEGITSISTLAFNECDQIKYVEFPSTINYVGQACFGWCDNLVLVSFDKVDAKIRNAIANGETYTKVTFNNCGTFKGCPKLVALSVPEGTTHIINRFVAQGCTSLTAFYMPNTVTFFGTNGGGQGPFCDATKMYFVQEPFTVGQCLVDGQIDLTKLDLPEKPEIYIMPTALATLDGHIETNQYSKNGTIFQKCYALNDVLVFPETFTVMNANNMFNSIGTADSPKTVVFTGNMTQYITNQNAKYISFVFANAQDKSPADIGITRVIKNNNNTNSYMYFCASGLKYNYSVASAEITDAEAIEAYINGLASTNEVKHIQNPKAASSQPATCTESAMTFKTCFCNAKYDITEDKENPALGHIYNLDSITAMVYADYTKDGVITCGCDREGCEGVKAETIKGSYLFTYNGYSRNSKGDMCVGYIVNAEYLECYKTLKQESFSFGLVSTVIDFDDEGVILDGEDNPLAPDYEGKVMSLDLTERTGFSAYDMIITGFGEAHKDLFLAMNLYVIDGESTSYIWNNAESGTNAVVNYKQYSAIPA